MALGLLATKEGMTRLFLDNGTSVPITVLKVSPNVIVSKKNINMDGYNALQIGYGSIRKKLLNSSQVNLYKKNGIMPVRKLVEFRVSEDDLSKYKIGEHINLDIFKSVDRVNVSALSKGKGFQGVMKRHNFSGSDRTHGTHESFRGGGSIGQCTKPGKVFKGKKMAGQMGNKNVTLKNIKIIELIHKFNVICLLGSTMGSNGTMIKLQLA